MAERKSGPIKPPTLDLKANEAEKNPSGKPAAAGKQATGDPSRKTAAAASPENAKPESKPAGDETGAGTTTGASTGNDKPTGTEGKEKPTAGATGGNSAGTGKTGTPPPPEESDSALWPFIATGICGAIAGLALAYGLATTGYWPQAAGQSGAIADIRQNMANLQGDVIARVTAIETRLESLTTASETTDLAALGNEIETIEQRLAALEQAPVSGETPDLAGLDTRFTDLSARLDALESRPVPDTAGTEVTGRLSTLSEQQSEAQTALSDAQAQVESLTADLSGLTERLARLETEMEARPEADQDTTMRLPLALSGLETATATGRSFTAELNALADTVPNLTIPASLRAAAATGLARPDEIETSVRRAVPEILAAKPPLVDAGWTERTLDRLASLFAIRPSADPNGTTPEALVSRLEDAVARRDFVAANSILEALPDPMREAAGTVAGEIARQAAATQLAAAARQAALESPETSQ